MLKKSPTPLSAIFSSCILLVSQYLHIYFFFFLETNPTHPPAGSTTTPKGFWASCINFVRSLNDIPFRSNATFAPSFSQKELVDGEEPSPSRYLFKSTPTCFFTKETISLCCFAYLEWSTKPLLALVELPEPRLLILGTLLSALSLFCPPHLFGFRAALGLVPLGIG